MLTTALFAYLLGIPIAALTGTVISTIFLPAPDRLSAAAVGFQTGLLAGVAWPVWVVAGLAGF